MSRPTPGALRAARKLYDYFYSDSSGESSDQTIAKAAELIDRETAVSDLLAALERAERALSAFPNLYPTEQNAALSQARAAIAKARGESR